MLARDELPRDTVALARFLIGTILIGEGDAGRVSATIVETEAYLPGDPASHAYPGVTARNGAMFLEHGRAYVYLIYGLHHCLNVTSEADGTGAAVLLRAARPRSGLALMRARRLTPTADRDLLRGPGRLARAFGVDRGHDALDLCAPGPLRLAAPSRAPALRIGCSVRIGLTKNADAPLRFFALGDRHVSGPKRLAAN